MNRVPLIFVPVLVILGTLGARSLCEARADRDRLGTQVEVLREEVRTLEDESSRLERLVDAMEWDPWLIERLLVESGRREPCPAPQ